MSSEVQFQKPAERSTQPDCSVQLEPKGCCDQVVQALGRVWTWIVNGWRWLVDKVFRGVDAVAFGFFRVVEFFFPKLALRMEAAYGYLSTWYARHSAAVEKTISDKTIQGLEVTNKQLHQEVEKTKGDFAVLKVKHKQAVAAETHMKSSRNEVVRENARALSVEQESRQEVLLVKEQNTLLETENGQLQERLEEEVSSKGPLVTENVRLTDEVNNLKRETKLANLRKKQAEGERDLALRSVFLIEQLDEMIAQKKERLHKDPEPRLCSIRNGSRAIRI